MRLPALRNQEMITISVATKPQSVLERSLQIELNLTACDPGQGCRIFPDAQETNLAHGVSRSEGLCCNVQQPADEEFVLYSLCASAADPHSHSPESNRGYPRPLSCFLVGTMASQGPFLDSLEADWVV